MNQMAQKIVAMIALGISALVIGLAGALRQAQAQEVKEPYPSMAPGLINTTNAGSQRRDCHGAERGPGGYLARC